MNPKLGNVSFPEKSGQEFHKPYSEKTAELIDEEVRGLISTAYERTLKLVQEKKVLIEQLASRLLEAETINHDVIVSVLGPRPHQPHSYKQYVSSAGDIDWDTKKPHQRPGAKPAASGDHSSGSAPGSGGSGGLPNDPTPQPTAPAAPPA